MIKTMYDLRNTDAISTPALIYYEATILDNTREAIRIAGGAERMWPHVKTHKMREMVRMQMEFGISRFKCSTIAECEMAASCGAGDVLLAYPLVGPAIERFLRLVRLFPGTRLWAIGDDLGQLRELGRQADALGFSQRVLVDIDMGMHRTGVPVDSLERFYREASALTGIDVLGLHGYDGNHNQSDVAARSEAAGKCTTSINAVRASLTGSGLDCGVSVMGGTPSFPCHAQTPGVYLSPGTLFVFDHSYRSKFPDLKFTPAAAIATRVISRPVADRFTVDLGYKAIAADPAGVRGVIASLPDTEPVSQNEEHWIFKMKEGSATPMPEIGQVLYVIPTHVCPTTALYPSVLVARGGEVADTWEVAARNRKITV